MDIDLQQLNCTPSTSLITHGQVTQLVRPFIFLQSFLCHFPSVGRLPINIQETFSHFISVMNYIQVVLLFCLLAHLNADMYHLAQVQCSSTGTEDCVAALRNPLNDTEA